MLTMEGHELHEYQEAMLNIYNLSCQIDGQIMKLKKVHAITKKGREKLECFIKALRAQTETIDSLYLLMYEWHDDIKQEIEAGGGE